VIDEEKVPAYDVPLAEDEPWLTTSEVMGLLNVSRATLSNWRKSGRLRAYRVGLRAVRYKRSELSDFICQANTVKRI
jgi:excisionase family DNA binding protein